MHAANDLLLVEDDATTRELLTLLLAQEGWTVHDVEHGEAALELLQSRATRSDEAELPCLVLSDQKLPGIHGSEFAKAVRELYAQCQQQAPVLLAMTATRNAEVQGYDRVLTKPFSASSVREIFEQSQQRSLLQSRADRSHPADIPPGEDNADVPEVDQPTFLKLARSMGAEPLRAMYAFALEDATTRLRTMQSALNAGNPHTVGTEAHMLKGAAGMVGARRLALLASEIEAHCAAERIDRQMLATKLVMIAATLADIPLVLETLLAARP